LVKLNNVTLVAIDCVDTKRIMYAVRQTLSECDFPHIRIFSSREVGSPDWVAIPELTTRTDYSTWLLRELWRHVPTTHALIIQHDGFVLNGEAWNPAWLEYDYIGAPWSQFEDGNRVGNGGFSLRSWNLLYHADGLVQPGMRIDAEDCFICRDHYHDLLACGIRFAPVNVAMQFSVEGIINHPKVWAGQFGFHNPGATDLTRWPGHRKYYVQHMFSEHGIKEES